MFENKDRKRDLENKGKLKRMDKHEI